MDRSEVETITSRYSQSGYHCAESVAATITGLFQKESTAHATKTAGGFGGGIGGSKTDVCGALSGGILALGCLFGRTGADQSRDLVYDLTKEFRRRFSERFGSTNCHAILQGFDAGDAKMRCRSLTAETAGMVYALLQEIGHTHRG